MSTTKDKAAADPKAGMTLDEVEAFVEEARKVGIPGDAAVRANRIKLKLLMVKG